MQAINSPCANLVRAVRGKLTSMGCDLKLDRSKDEVGTSTRGRDFQTIAQLLYLIFADLSPSKAKSKYCQPTPSRIESLLTNHSPVPTNVQAALEGAMSTLCVLVHHPVLGQVLTTGQHKISPVEFVMIGFLLYLYHQSHSLEQLSHAVHKLRKDVRNAHKAVRFNTVVYKHLLNFVLSVKGMKLKGEGSVPAAKVRMQDLVLSSSASPKSKTTTAKSASVPLKRKRADRNDENGEGAKTKRVKATVPSIVPPVSSSSSKTAPPPPSRASVSAPMLPPPTPYGPLSKTQTSPFSLSAPISTPAKRRHGAHSDDEAEETIQLRKMRRRCARELVVTSELEDDNDESGHEDDGVVVLRNGAPKTPKMSAARASVKLNRGKDKEGEVKGKEKEGVGKTKVRRSSTGKANAAATSSKAAGEIKSAVKHTNSSTSSTSKAPLPTSLSSKDVPSAASTSTTNPKTSASLSSASKTPSTEGQSQTCTTALTATASKPPTAKKTLTANPAAAASTSTAAPALERRAPTQIQTQVPSAPVTVSAPPMSSPYVRTPPIASIPQHPTQVEAPVPATHAPTSNPPSLPHTTGSTRTASTPNTSSNTAHTLPLPPSLRRSRQPSVTMSNLSSIANDGGEDESSSPAVCHLAVTTSTLNIQTSPIFPSQTSPVLPSQTSPAPQREWSGSKPLSGSPQPTVESRSRLEKFYAVKEQVRLQNEQRALGRAQGEQVQREQVQRVQQGEETRWAQQEQAQQIQQEQARRVQQEQVQRINQQQVQQRAAQGQNPQLQHRQQATDDHVVPPVSTQMAADPRLRQQLQSHSQAQPKPQCEQVWNAQLRRSDPEALLHEHLDNIELSLQPQSTSPVSMATSANTVHCTQLGPPDAFRPSMNFTTVEATGPSFPRSNTSSTSRSQGQAQGQVQLSVDTTHVDRQPAMPLLTGSSSFTSSSNPITSPSIPHSFSSNQSYILLPNNAPESNPDVIVNNGSARSMPTQPRALQSRPTPPLSATSSGTYNTARESQTSTDNRYSHDGNSRRYSRSNRGWRRDRDWSIEPSQSRGYRERYAPIIVLESVMLNKTRQ